jgi:arabinogalactan endo-1,4-beta-galactosidase
LVTKVCRILALNVETKHVWGARIAPTDGYPLNENGQAMWLADLVALVRSDRNFGGVIYFSPEWYNEAVWDAFALFNAAGVARPGIRSFQL